ncbi:MAG: AAA family ATPase, partial [Thermotogota bacterium]
MLREVHARNFLLFKDVSVDFHNGFNVITGETGAGKSMFVRLLRSLFGDYKAKEMIGPFEDGFWIEAVFDNEPEIVQMLVQSDIPVDDPMIIKIAGSSDRFTARINGSVVSSKILRDFLPRTFEIHSQNAFQKLRTDSFHIEIVDRYAGSKLTTVFEEYTKHFKKYNELKTLQKELPGNSSEMLRTLDFLNFQIQEIEEATLRKNEDVEVSNELKALSNYDYIRTKLSSVLSILDDSPEMPSVIDRIGDICGNLEDISGIEETAENWLQTAMTAQDTLSVLSREVYSYLDNFEFDEERMNELDERMKVIESMKRKYGPELDDVFNNLEKFTRQKE